MVERCQLLRREYVLHIKSLSAEIHNQAKVLSSVHEKQEGQARVIANAVERLQQNGDVLQAKIQKASEFQTVLTKRAQKVMEVITSQKQGLSTAEKQFLKELREKKQMLPAFKAKIDQLRNQSQELLKKQEETPYAISERHLKKIQPILEEEMKMIADTVDGLRKLQIDVDKEFPDS
jgi:predicted GTPase